MPPTGYDKVCATTRGSDEYVLNAWQDEEDHFQSEIIVFRNFQLNSDVYTGEKVIPLQAPSIEEIERRFIVYLDKIAPESEDAK